MAAHVRKSFSSAFVLDKGKLERILEIIEQRLSEIDDSFKPRFDVRLSNGKQIYVTSTEELLGLDNVVKNPISSLTIQVGSDLLQRSRNEEVRGKGYLTCNISFDRSKRMNIALIVQSEDESRASRCFAELEEQVERTLSKNWLEKFSIGNIIGTLFIATIMIALAALLFSIGGPSRESSGYMLTKDDFAEFERRMNDVKSESDKVAFLFDLEKQQLQRSLEKQNRNFFINPRSILSWKNVFIILPFVVILCCVGYLRDRCYPHAVFLWGDYESHYNKLLSIRRTVWQVVIGSLLIGILGNLFVFGLSSKIG